MSHLYHIPTAHVSPYLYSIYPVSIPYLQPMSRGYPISRDNVLSTSQHYSPFTESTPPLQTMSIQYPIQTVSTSTVPIMTGHAQTVPHLYRQCPNTIAISPDSTLLLQPKSMPIPQSDNTQSLSDVIVPICIAHVQYITHLYIQCPDITPSLQPLFRLYHFIYY